MKVERALLSVSDKTGIVEFGKGLVELGVEILSTGGTARALRDGGVEVVDVSEFTGHPEMMDGRVKTLHPNVHGGILARRDRPDDMAQLAEHGRGPIDLVAVNLYPFEETIAREDATFADCLEQIDIGGPCLLRASAKSHPDVLVVSSPSHYEGILEAIRADKVSDDLRKRMAYEAFVMTARYDAAISRWFAGRKAPDSEPADLGLKKAGRLRHGDNTWQDADLYLTGGDLEPCAVRAASKGPAEPASLRELVDIDRAFELVKQFANPAAAVVRGGVPIGVAIGDTLTQAVQKLVDSGACATAGCAVAVNTPVDPQSGDLFAPFAENVASFIAPTYVNDAHERLGEGVGRVLETGKFEGRGRDADHIDVCRVTGGLVLQERDLGLLGEDEPRVLSDRAPKKDEKLDLLFAFACAKHAASRSVVIAKDGVLLGLGSGQPSVEEAFGLALRAAGAEARGAVLATDGPLAKVEIEMLREAAIAGVRGAVVSTGDADEALASFVDGADMSLVVSPLSHLR